MGNLLDPSLKHFWITFGGPKKSVPKDLKNGCGITASTLSEALALLNSFAGPGLPELGEV